MIVRKFLMFVAVLFSWCDVSFAWKFDGQWPLNGGGYCNMISNVGNYGEATSRLIVSKSMNFQGLIVVFDQMPASIDNGAYTISADDQPWLEMSTSWLTAKYLLIPFKVHAWVDEWEIVEPLIRSGRLLKFGHAEAGKPMLSIKTSNSEQAYSEWRQCLDRTE